MATERTHLTIKEVCEELGISKWTVYRAIKEGQLKAVRYGWLTIRVRRKDLEAWDETPESERVQQRLPRRVSGVYQLRKKWRAQVHHNGRMRFLGSFDTQKEAEDAVRTFHRAHAPVTANGNA